MKSDNKSKKDLRILLRAVIIAVAGILLGVNTYALIAERVADNAMPMPFGFGASVVLSGSMEPELHVNDLILVRAADNYSVGDIVIYQDLKGDLVVHRIVSLNDDDTITTKGDNNEVEDPPIGYSALKGRLVKAIPHVGTVIFFMKSPLGVFLIVAAAVILLELSFRREKASDDAQLDEIKAEIRRLQAEQNKKKD